MKMPSFPVEFTEEGYRGLVHQLNAFFTNIGIENFSGEIMEDLHIPAGETAYFPHTLRTVPNYRIILRQEGNGLITDGERSNSSIALTNNSTTEDVTISVFIGSY